MVGTWYIILVMLCTTPPCELRYDPRPWTSLPTCIQHGKVLSSEHKAMGFACRRKIPKSAIKLPAHIPPGRWA